MGKINWMNSRRECVKQCWNRMKTKGRQKQRGQSLKYITNAPDISSKCIRRRKSLVSNGYVVCNASNLRTIPLGQRAFAECQRLIWRKEKSLNAFIVDAEDVHLEINRIHIYCHCLQFFYLNVSRRIYYDLIVLIWKRH